MPNKVVDMVGKSFGRLTVVGRAGNDARRQAAWLCRCECGRQKVAAGISLRQGGVKSCGCLLGRHADRVKPGDRVGRTTVVAVEYERGRTARCVYDCGCGRRRVAWGSQIGKVEECGWCSRRRTHEACGDLSGDYWASVERNAVSRGIEFTVTAEYGWSVFVEQDGRCALTGVKLSFYDVRTNRKKQTASLDRKDSNKGYVPGNVQWVHKTINRIKSDLAQDEFVAWCRLVADNTKEGEDDGTEEVYSSCRSRPGSA